MPFSANERAYSGKPSVLSQCAMSCIAALRPAHFWASGPAGRAILAIDRRAPQPDGSYDFEFCLNGQWHRLPLSALDHAATEVSITAGADVAPLNYAEGVALLLAALDKHNWLVRPPHREPAARSIHDKQFQDA
jgi:hypothetical protein